MRITPFTQNHHFYDFDDFYEICVFLMKIVILSKSDLHIDLQNDNYDIIV